ncbi:EAL domain-containing protein [Grimontia sp. NTOU-MAR1]|uniref:EAL domain-containing protein n=1 Tax=Grimontia sp. NTOU-MAR1 TaxID=3111011 RepID=UPI002DB63351|nr:EAL domain-containing protein [Grimontia sp. NTOU-MAR1]WRV97978.1 EAL domain-containing protein [Grimontia sp. NTOU-MAR1]
MDKIKRLRRDVFFMAIKESFISTVPYLVISSIIVLINQLLLLTGLSSSFINSALLSKIIGYMSNFFPVILMTSIAFHFSKRYNINNIFIITLSFAIFITIESIINAHNSQSLLNDAGVSFFVLIIPIVSIVLFNIIPKFEKDLKLSNGQLSHVFFHLKSFVIIYFFSIVTYLIVLRGLETIASSINFSFLDLDLLSVMALRTLGSQILWFFGAHGPNTLSIIEPNNSINNILINNVSYQAFYDVFIVFGGSGAGLSLILAALIYSKSKHITKISKISLPFAIFNINETLIYGLPIVLNRFLLIPFITIPLLNIAIAFFFLDFFGITFVNNQVSWITPIFINAFIATGGNGSALLLQVVLVVIGIIVYTPFIKRYSLAQSSSNHVENLKNNLEMIELMESTEGIKSNISESKIIKSNLEVDKIINFISSNKLAVHYQPKIDIIDQHCSSYEALLRIRKDDGTISGPFFLESLELAGLASIIDLWVCRELKKHYQIWQLSGFNPKVAINIHPDTMTDNKAIGLIINELKGLNVEFEIIERESVKSPSSISNIMRLHDSGFDISLDDFGVGYSSFETLTFLPMNTVKIDKSLIDNIESEKGYHICKNIFTMCNDLGLTCVAEGVEKDIQYLKLKSMGVRYIQGFYFEKALPFNRIDRYKPTFKVFDFYQKTAS